MYFITFHPLQSASFCREMCVQYDDCSADILKSFIDRTMNDSEYGENMQRACREMRENEKENTRRLSDFFNKEVKSI